jgi:type IV pilus assembly protein PilC
MPSFQFTAVDATGEQHEDVRDAESKEDLKQALAAEGLQVLTVSLDLPSVNILTPRVKQKDLLYITSQLAVMIETGINVTSALESVCEQVENARLRHALEQVRLGVEGGDDLSSMLEEHPKIFDAKITALVRASEQTGTLGEMLERISNDIARDIAQRGKIKSALTYPAVMASVAVGVTIFLLTFIMPQFEPLFKRRNVELPKITSVLMAVSHMMLEYWWAWLGGLIICTVSLVYWLKSKHGQRTMDGFRIYAPLLGPTVRLIILARSVRTLGLMIKSGVSMLDALQLTSEVAGNHYYKLVWLEVIDRVTQGERIVDTLRGNPLFPKSLVQMIGSGEETGKLDFVLEKISRHYEEETASSIKSVTTMVEPLLITVMGFVVGGISMSLLLPIFRLSRAH